MPDYVPQLDITLSALRDALRGADNRTLTDLYNHLQYLGTYRLQYKAIGSGAVSVPAASETEYASVSGTGIFIAPRRHKMEGYSTFGNVYHRVRLDNLDLHTVLAGAFPASLNQINAWGYNSVGNYELGNIAFRTNLWDTTNDIYEVVVLSFPQIPFRNSLSAKLVNNDSTTDVTQHGVISYALFVASKQALMVIPVHISATLLRKLVDKRVSAIEVMTMGYFEEESEIPYIEFLKDEKNYHLSKLASKKPLSYVTITYPENVNLKNILNRFKPKKILHDDILE